VTSGDKSWLTAIILNIGYLITPANIEFGLKIIMFSAAIAASIFAILYHIEAKKKTKLERKKLERELE